MSPSSAPTLWGLSPLQMHDLHWRRQAAQVVRLGQIERLHEGSVLYLLLPEHSLVLFDLPPLLEAMDWIEPTLAGVFLESRQPAGHCERLLADRENRFLTCRRSYTHAVLRHLRLGATRDLAAALAWQRGQGAGRTWRRLRRLVPADKGLGVVFPGRHYDSRQLHAQEEFLCHLLAGHLPPVAGQRGLRQLGPHVWADGKSQVAEQARIIGPAWIGRGRHLQADDLLLGPAILWDADARRGATAQDVSAWQHFLNGEHLGQPHDPLPKAYRISKRVFDLFCAIMALAVTLPLYPLIALAIVIDDGRPVLFAHRRQGRGGRSFPCWKFRSMRQNAEQLKEQLAAMNMADGPQFFIDNDPRLTRVGRILRRFNLDELPQFLNILSGDMSLVGPRPSPHSENQYCPAWREARLSVRPGITGLWQVKRSRLPGLDFQEWIRYDLEYVSQASWKLDLAILWQTLVMMIPGGKKKQAPAATAAAA